jgi:hypothetical protein
MKLHRLRVSNLAAIRDAEIEFGPGLNVLYGPNDLGKSTLVDAVRFALLLPHTSSFCDEFISWAGAFNPVIELTFETEAQRIWRVKKEFGRGGSSLLQESRNGRDFDDVVRARNVDAKLRQILQWGIAEPGGTGGSKGLPLSFLATALLSTQADVTDMLRDSLQDDSTTSGKERIEAALQAVAQDPMFIALLRCTQERRDSAYTPTGGKKTAKGSVFKAAADRLNQARDEKERLQQIVTDSQGAEKHLRELMERRAQQQDALGVVRDHAAVLERLASQALNCAAAAEQVRLAEEEVKRIKKIEMDVQSAESTLADLARKMTGAEQTLRTARAQQVAATAALESAAEAARAQGADPAVTDTVIRQKLDLRKVEADRAALAAQQQFDAATGVQRLVNAVIAAEHDYDEQRAAADRARAASSDATTKENRSADLLRQCDLLERALDIKAAQTRVANSQADVDKERVIRERLDLIVGERETLAKQRAEFTVPAHGELLVMRRLSTDLAAARAKLDVGLVVTVSPNSQLKMEVRKDGADSTSATTTRPLEIEANAEVEITIPDVATVLVRGGRRNAQKNLRILEDRWNHEVLPHLERADVTDIEGLDAKIAYARELDASIKSKDLECESLRSQIAGLAGASDALREASEQADTCRAALGEVSLEMLAADLKKLGSDPALGLRKKRQHLSAELEAARKIATEAATTLTLTEERSRTSKLALEEAVRNRDVAMTGFPNGITEALQNAQASLAAANVEKKTIEDELASLEKAIQIRKERVEAAVASARKIAEKARAEVDRTEAELTKARTDHAAQVGLIEGLRRVREAEDVSSAETTLKAALERRGSLPVPERNVSDQELSAARNKADATASALKALDGEILRAHGALAQVGGSVARERLRDAMEAFELAERQEKEVEEEYEAWKLLLEQMREAEKAQASNLGQALAPAIAGRFQALTRRRYENVQLTAQLGTEGVVVAGAVRPTERMSVGTREQLSTLYRLSLAEYLQTVVVLDDQLVQSDETRMDWFRELLKEKSRNFQIVVFTCRPRDYLDKTSMVPKGKALHADTDEGFTRAIDLGRALGKEQMSAKS